MRKQHFDRPIASFSGNIEPSSMPVKIVIVPLNVVQCIILPSHLPHKFPIQLFYFIFIQKVWFFMNCFLCILSPWPLLIRLILTWNEHASNKIRGHLHDLVLKNINIYKRVIFVFFEIDYLYCNLIKPSTIFYGGQINNYSSSHCNYVN